MLDHHFEMDRERIGVAESLLAFSGAKRLMCRYGQTLIPETDVVELTESSRWWIWIDHSTNEGSTFRHGRLRWITVSFGTRRLKGN